MNVTDGRAGSRFEVQGSRLEVSTLSLEPAAYSHLKEN